ncbi:MAG: aldehyde dehydrogenase family protein [Myxococcota bacterium]
MGETFDNPGNFLDGAFVAASGAELCVRSPADQKDIVGRHGVDPAHVDRAVEGARKALPAWRRLGKEGRSALLRTYQERLRHHRSAIAETIAREVGKPLWDSNGEAGALAGKVDLMLGEGAAWTEDRSLSDLPGEIRYQAHGVLSVVGPFNFPAHLPNGQIVPALLAGNTIVFKPSEKTPNAAVWLARCFQEAGFPPGVVNVVQGGPEVAKRLVAHDDIDGVLFTGSLAVGRRVLEANLHRPGCLIALELGGKNASIVLDDADIARAVNQIAFAAYATTGQRCTATSRVYVTKGAAPALLEGLQRIAKGLVVGYPLDEGVFMGPLISEASRSALFSAQARAREAGFEAVVEGGVLDVDGREGWYVRPSIHRAPRADIRVEGYTHDELFGPDVAIYEVDSLDEAVALANGTEFGLAAAVFTESEASFEKAADELRVGVLHWNQSSAGASGRLPFGGVKGSGNHRPAGITAGAFCAWPQAVRFRPSGDLPTWPGFTS